MPKTMPLNTVSTEKFRESIEYHIRYSLGTSVTSASVSERQNAIALSVRDLTIDNLAKTSDNMEQANQKQVCYLSMEFLIGRLLHNNMLNLGIFDQVSDAVEEFDWSLTDILESERDPSLGNGGLGRLAACFLDSLATMGYAGVGYGINYQYGLFQQSFVDGHQREYPDNWLAEKSAWLIERPNDLVVIPCFGRIEHGIGRDGEYSPQWVDWKVIIGRPFDMPVVGFGNERVNPLRLYAAESPSDFDMDAFNEGDYLGAMEQAVDAQTVSKVLYPSDATDTGKELRLLQEYFFVACALRDITRTMRKRGQAIETLPDHFAIQLNDTHPALAVPELMRLLMDEHSLDWEQAFALTQKTLAYTNHTLLPEALEKWPLAVVEKILPRHCQIIHELNRQLLIDIGKRFPGDMEKAEKMSILEERPDRNVRMANLSIVGSHSVNGVAYMHSELVKHQLVPEFYEYSPEKFNNKTNGVTQRRWLNGCNPGLSTLITEVCGVDWTTDLEVLGKLEGVADDSEFQSRFRTIKQTNKSRLASEIWKNCRIKVEEHSLFDVQIKRIHEYKRQLLNAMHIAHLYHSIVEDGLRLHTPRTFIFAGKAAPSYHVAKLIIKYINSLASVINADPQVNDQIRIVFYPDYRVSVAEKIIPAANLSEQISTAGFEASGTGNMKLTLNGALTVGTLDGANVEICEEVGKENIYIFGNTDSELISLRHRGYSSVQYYESNNNIRRVIGSMLDGTFTKGDTSVFQPVVDSLLGGNDYFMLFPDFDSYAEIQSTIDEAYQDTANWDRMAILNVARSGKFSSDRTIREYADDIWGIQSNNIEQRRKVA